MNNKHTFKGKILKDIFKSDSFSVYALDVNRAEYPNIKRNRYGNVSISGELYDLCYGVEYIITAEESNTKYGVGYNVINISREMPTTRKGVVAFLKEILTENQAEVLVENYPNIIDMVRNNETSSVDLSKLKGIGAKTFEKIKDKIITNYYLMDLVAEFQNVLSLSVLKKIYDEYSSVELLRKKIRAEPYTTLTRVSGIGFKTADDIVMRLYSENIIDFGYDIGTSEDRCLACVLYLLSENESSGHTKMNLADLRQQCSKLVPECAGHFESAIQSDFVYYDKATMDIAHAKTYKTEKYIADTILANVHVSNNIWNINTAIYKTVDGFELTDDQIKILDVVCKNNISILCGFAGSGKTTSVRGLIRLLEDNHKTFLLLSPTGRATKVLSENTNEPASTIHRGLGFKPPNTWSYNEGFKLPYDIVVVDEFSMTDIWLFKRTLEAIDFRTTKLLLIGDNAQLPSVSCGNLLHDFMESKIIPSVVLDKIFRYSSSGLMKIATDVRRCKPYLSNGMKTKATSFGDSKDYMFVDIPSDRMAQNVVALYQKLLHNGSNVEDIQVLTAKNIGGCGSIELNNMIQKVANPNYGRGISMTVGEMSYYKGDLILQTVNNYKAEIYNKNLCCFDEGNTTFVANGETGIITDVCDSYIIANFNGVSVKYYKKDMSMVKLGYCISIHKSQGGGFKTVILCTPQSHTFMLNSNLLYVGITRTVQRCFHLGSVNSVNQAVCKKENLSRSTFMQYLLLGNN